MAVPALGSVLPCPALAVYPERPVRLVVPFAPGGGGDILARIVATPMASRLGRPVIVDNRLGAGGSVGTEMVARAPADGYTLLFGSGGPLVGSPVLQARLGYDVERDFLPVGLVAITPVVYVAGSKLQATNLTDLLAYARAHPGQVSVATGGIGSAAHLALEVMNAAAGVRMTHVPYRGGGPVVPDLMAGTVDAAMIEISIVLPLHQEGSIRIIGVAAASRSALLPEVPTFIEAGLPGFTAGSFGGLLAPAGTPEPVIAALHSALTRTLADAPVQERIVQLGSLLADASQATPQGFATFLRQELASARRAAELAGLKPE